ncbi:MAG: helix-turn-helix domain-containing protein, partial [Solirubrobacterales bacterium]|nr:helix-turn-helix domain-containing protein [Solirubrobacterales bacterium]
SGAARERVTCIRLLALGRTGSDVAEAIGRSVNTVYRHKRRFLEEGEATLLAEGWGGRRNAVLTEAEEAELAADFERAARDGELITANAVIAAVAKRAGRRVDPTTVYRMLRRHGWRKVTPRPRHPDADPDRQEAFKETLSSLGDVLGPGLGVRHDLVTVPAQSRHGCLSVLGGIEQVIVDIDEVLEAGVVGVTEERWGEDLGRCGADPRIRDEIGERVRALLAEVAPEAQGVEPSRVDAPRERVNYS